MRKPSVKSNAEIVDDAEVDPNFVSPPVRIYSSVEGFRRGGIAHPRGPKDYAEGAFTEAQLNAIDAEPKLQLMRAVPSVAADGQTKTDAS